MKWKTLSGEVPSGSVEEPNALGASIKRLGGWRNSGMSKSRERGLIVAVVVAVAVTLGVSSVAYLWQGFTPTGQGSQDGVNGNGASQAAGMMGGWSYLSNDQLAAIKASQPAAEANGTLTFSGGSIMILVLMGPMTQDRNMYSFVIDNLTNPTLVIPRGTRVTMIVANVDTDAYHALALTGIAPPYAYNLMPMMMSSLASTRVLPPSSSGFATQQISFTVSGGLYYACPVPGHAQSGMYGQIRAG